MTRRVMHHTNSMSSMNKVHYLSQKLYKGEDNPKPTSSQILKLAEDLRQIGPDLKDMMLLHMAKEYVDSGPKIEYKEGVVPSHDQIN